MKNFNVNVGDNSFQIDEIIEFLAKIYGPNYLEAKRVQGAILRNEPTTKPQNFIITRSKNNDLIGLIRIVERKIVLGTGVLCCGGVSSVSVHPDFRGHGIMKAMMEIAHDVMNQRNMELAYLHGRRALDGYYIQFGYRGINRYLDLEIISSHPEKEMIAAVSFSERNLENIMNMYSGTYASLSGSIIRDKSVWGFLLSKMTEINRQVNLFECYASQSGDLIGYFIIDGQKVIEMSLPTGYFPYVSGLIKKLNLTHISIHPQHPFYAYARSTMSTCQHERFSLDGGYMGKILNRYRLLSKIGPDICLRALRIELKNKQIRLFGYELEMDSGEIKEACAPDDIVFKTERSAIRCILGIDRLENNLEVHMNKDKPWLACLFPLTGFHTSSWDEI